MFEIIKRLFTPEAVIIQPEVVEVRENSNDSLKGLSATFLERCEELRKMEEERSRKLDKGLFLFSSYLEKKTGFPVRECVEFAEEGITFDNNYRPSNK